MASVRLTKDLRSDIVYNVKISYVDMVEKAEKSIPDDFGIKCANFAYDHLVKPYVEQIPTHWMTEVQTCNIRIWNKAQTSSIYNEEIRYSAPLPCPKIKDLTRISYKHDAKLALEANDIQYPDHLVAIAQEWRDRIDQVNTERNTAVEGVQKMLSNCNTLKQLLTVWPEGERFIPDGAMEKHREIKEVTRRAREDKTEELKEIAGGLNAGLLRKQIYENL